MLCCIVFSAVILNEYILYRWFKNNSRSSDKPMVSNNRIRKQFFLTPTELTRRYQNEIFYVTSQSVYSIIVTSSSVPTAPYRIFISNIQTISTDVTIIAWHIINIRYLNYTSIIWQKCVGLLFGPHCIHCVIGLCNMYLIEVLCQRVHCTLSNPVVMMFHIYKHFLWR